MGKLVRCFLWTLITAVGFADTGMTEKTAVNQSGLVFEPNTVKGAAADYHPPHICSGKLKQDVLAKIKLSTELLLKGLECVAGDFDGNGFLDFALYPRRSLSEFYSEAQVIFFQDSRVERVSTLSDPPIQLWPSGTEGVCFRKISKTDALQQAGGGERDRTATYNSKTGTWERDECGGEEEGE